MLLIGSGALESRYMNIFNESRRTKCNDTDFIGTWDEIEEWIKIAKPTSIRPANKAKNLFCLSNDRSIMVEFEIAWTDSCAAELIRLTMADPETMIERNWLGEAPLYKASLNLLYTLKMSHRYLRNSPHFLKTMSDIHLFRKHSAVISDMYLDWYKARQKETYHYKHPSLSMKAGEFFNPTEVQYIYDHDSIHRVVARQKDTPAYTLFKKDGAEVQVDKAKWELLPLEVKLNAVLEESYVLALERSQVPYKGQVDPTTSFDMALMKVCTSITSGWFRDFAWENYYTVKSLYNPDYTNNFWRAVGAGEVPLHKPTSLMIE